MKIAPIAEVKSRFSAYVKASEESPIVITRNGKAVAMIVSISDDEEIERLLLAHSKKLQRLLDQAEQGIQDEGGIRHEDLWSQLDAEYADKEQIG